MKRNIFFAMILVFTGDLASAQDDQMFPTGSKYDYLNFSFSVGVVRNVYSSKLQKYENPGLNYNIDISLTSKNSAGFFANYAFSDISGNYINDYLNSLPDGKSDVKLSQFTAGPRFYSKNKNSFIDGGIGFYKMGFHEDVGMTVGGGLKYRL